MDRHLQYIFHTSPEEGKLQTKPDIVRNVEDERAPSPVTFHQRSEAAIKVNRMLGCV